MAFLDPTIIAAKFIATHASVHSIYSLLLRALTAAFSQPTSATYGRRVYGIVFVTAEAPCFSAFITITIGTVITKDLCTIRIGTISSMG